MQNGSDTRTEELVKVAILQGATQGFILGPTEVEVTEGGTVIVSVTERDAVALVRTMLGYMATHDFSVTAEPYVNGSFTHRVIVTKL